jgi:hypothetical protein
LVQLRYLGAVITAFYMTRVMIDDISLEHKRWADDAHPHESPFLMWVADGGSWQLDQSLQGTCFHSGEAIVELAALQ